jgi:hypothetical protein
MAWEGIINFYYFAKDLRANYGLIYLPRADGGLKALLGLALDTINA